MEVFFVLSAVIMSGLVLLVGLWAVWESRRGARIVREIRRLERELDHGFFDGPLVAAEDEERQARIDYLEARLVAGEARLSFEFLGLRFSWRASPRRTSEKLINRKCSLISLILPAPQRARYAEEWKDEWLAMRRGDIPKQRFHALRLVRGAVVQSYEERTEVRKQVD
ncbi:hypothetical protein [Streptomyces sp. GQFP]|uniref:hypothetical protein n=1 Tax=Streptomyces sp. GQFP TaxID=2907545 RepID=UPI001F4211EF|nr:hypothetical protein [Streptomyces sp. GQFP]UIX31196.1 hypothetical protein LUX31_14750 [Streptomyces sp. GQFP]